MVKPIQTKYSGHKFRSRLEARWAVFFNNLNVKWGYEMEGYDLGDGVCYLPDFWLPDIDIRSTKTSHGTFIEIKSDQYDFDPKETKYSKFVGGLKTGLVLCCGLPDVLDFDSNGTAHEFLYCDYFEEVRQDNPMVFCKCYKCGKMKFEFPESNYLHCDDCGGKCDYKHPDIHLAINAAKEARFEFGEKG